METNQIIILVIGCVCAYLIAGVNPAIIFSKLLHKQDIRECGSGNPGFTNYKRTFGGIDAWMVFILDLAKTIVPVLVFSLVLKHMSGEVIIKQFSAQLIGLCAMIGHAYPVWYKFKGGKAFTTSMAVIYIVDWRVALVSTVIFLTLLLTIKFMSLASISTAIASPIGLTVVGIINGFSTLYIVTIILSALAGALLIFRHKSNIARLLAGKESRFYLFKRKKKKETPPAPADQTSEQPSEQTTNQ